MHCIVFYSCLCLVQLQNFMGMGAGCDRERMVIQSRMQELEGLNNKLTHMVHAKHGEAVIS